MPSDGGWTLALPYEDRATIQNALIEAIGDGNRITRYVFPAAAAGVVLCLAYGMFDDVLTRPITHGGSGDFDGRTDLLVAASR